MLAPYGDVHLALGCRPHTLTVTYQCPEVLLREPDISPKPQSRQTFINIHLEDFTLIL